MLAVLLLVACANSQEQQVEILPDGGIVCPSRAVHCGNICVGASKITRTTVCGGWFSPTPCDGGTSPSFDRVYCECRLDAGVGGITYYDTTDMTQCEAWSITWNGICGNGGG